MKTVIKITPGGDTISLYQDGHPLLGTGNVQLARASNVVWDEDRQEWRIKLKDKDGNEHDVELGFSDRSKAVDFEITMLHHLLTTDPNQADVVKALFENKDTAGASMETSGLENRGR